MSTLRDFSFFVSRWFHNKASKPFIENPYTEGGIQEEDGHLRRVNRRVTYVELLFDLFVVATLNVFTRETQLGQPQAIGSYIMFVGLIWAIWVGQSFYAVQFGSKDCLQGLFGLFQMLIYGYMSAAAGSFNVTYGLTHAHEADDDIPQYVQRVTTKSSELPQDIERSVRAVTVVFVVSRLLLLAQYAVPLVFAWRARRSRTPTLCIMIGIALNAVLWLVSLGVSFAHTRAAAIVRLLLWTTGIVLEWTFAIVSTKFKDSLYFELEYWCERFAGFTLIILGEGIIALFEDFRTFLIGVSAGLRNGLMFATLFSAVAIFRNLYYLYFQQHSHHLLGGPRVHLAWGGVHLILHLALLLFMQCIAKAVSAVNVVTAVERLTAILAKQPDDPPGGWTSVAQLATALTNSTYGQEMQVYAASLGLNFYSRISTFSALAQGNVTVFETVYVGDIFSILGRTVNSYGFEPTHEAYAYIDDVIHRNAVTDATTSTEVYMIMSPVYTACFYAFSVLAIFLISLVALGLMQQNLRDKWRRIGLAWRAFLGLAFGLCSLTYMGPNFSAYFNADENDDANVAPIYELITNGWLVPMIFLMLLSVNIVDAVLYFIKLYIRDRDARRRSYLNFPEPPVKDKVDFAEPEMPSVEEDYPEEEQNVRSEGNMGELSPGTQNDTSPIDEQLHKHAEEEPEKEDLSKPLA